MENCKENAVAPGKVCRFRKLLTLSGILAAIVVVLFLAASFLIPKVAKSYVESHSKDWISRRVAIDEISFNPFRFALSVKNFRLFESDDSTEFVAFREFFVNVDPSGLLGGNISLSEVKVDSPYARIVKNGEQFNFSDILKKISSSDSSGVSAPDSSKSASGGLPFGISVRNFSVLSGAFVFDDDGVNSHVGVQDFSLKVPEVYFSNKSTSAGIKLDFSEGGSLAVDADYNMQKGDFSVNVDLRRFSLATVKPYLSDLLNFKDLTGSLGVELKASGNVADVLSASAQGSVFLDSVVLTEVSGKSLGVNHIGVGIAEANLAENRFALDSVLVRGAFLHFDLGKKTNNLQELFSPQAKNPVQPDSVPEQVKSDTVHAVADSAESRKNLDFSLKKFSVSDTRFTLNDNTIPGTFSYTVSSIAVDASNLAFDKRVNVDVRSTLPRGGTVRATASLVPANLNSIRANVAVKNVDMRDFSKYAEHYTGYPLIAGRLAFASDNVLENDEIDSRNNIDIYDLTVGDKPDNAKPEFTVPMKIALYILKDKDGKIAFDVPVKGNIRDPEFSYGKIVWQTVMNLLVKVALSPAKLLLGSSVPSDFAFDVSADDLTSEQYDLAKTWTAVLTSKPGSSITLIQSYQPKRHLDAMAEALKKIEFYKWKTGKSTLTPVDRKAALDSEDSAELEQFANSWKRPSDGELLAEMEKLANVRNEKLLKFLLAQPGVNEKNLKVRLADASERSAAGKKSVFRMSVELP